VHAPPPRVHAEDGFTLIELMITIVIGLIALFAVLAFIVESQVHNNRVYDRVSATDESALGLQSLQDSLRVAYSISPAPTSGTQTSGTLTYTGLVQEGSSYLLHTYTVDCTGAGTAAGTSRCTRTDTTDGTGDTLVDDVVGSTDSIFTVHAAGSTGLPRVDIVLTRRTRDDRPPVRLQSSVTPRNCQITATTNGACPFP